MIHSIKCDKPSFKAIHFKQGFNVILAERTKESSKKDSRNGLGKSTLIEIIHFCLGGKKGETLNKHQLNDWTFTMEIDLVGKKYSISRNTSDANKIFIEGDCSEWFVKPTIDKKTGRQMISRKDFTRPLLVIDINRHKKEREKELTELANKAAQKVRRTKKPVIFKPMPAFERRFIHMKLAEQPDIVTESTGEDPERKVVIRLYP